MFVDLDWPLNASSLLSASAEILVTRATHSIAQSLLRQRVSPSIRPSVTPGIVSKRLNLSLNFFEHLLVVPSLGLFWPLRRYPIRKGTPSAGAINTRGGKNWRFSTDIAVYLGKMCKIGTSFNDLEWLTPISRSRRFSTLNISETTRDRAYSCYRTSIGSRICSMEWLYFQWPWWTPNFQGRGVFEVVEYLNTGAF